MENYRETSREQDSVPHKHCFPLLMRVFEGNDTLLM